MRKCLLCTLKSTTVTTADIYIRKLDHHLHRGPWHHLIIAQRVNTKLHSSEDERNYAIKECVNYMGKELAELDIQELGVFRDSAMMTLARDKYLTQQINSISSINEPGGIYKHNVDVNDLTTSGWRVSNRGQY